MESLVAPPGMARIENVATSEVSFLNAYHLFGRNSAICNTHLDNTDVSRSHATIYWSQEHWYLQDHSRNGTLVNGKWIRKTAVQLEPDALLQFGSADAPFWKIRETGAPANYLRSLSRPGHILVLDTCHALPDEQHPAAIVYKSEHKTWIAETAGEKITLINGTCIKVYDEEWEFVENDLSFDTVDYGQIFRSIYFKFCVSADEEDIQLKLIANGQEYDLGRRTYNYLLLSLTRKRLKDLDLGFSSDDQGWLSLEKLSKDVSKELGHEVDEYYLNLQIYRLRKHLMEMKPFGHLFSNVIERRTGELRFTFPQLKVVKENLCVGEIVYLPTG